MVKKVVEVVPYNPEWPRLFEAEANPFMARKQSNIAYHCTKRIVPKFKIW